MDDRFNAAAAAEVGERVAATADAADEERVRERAASSAEGTDGAKISSLVMSHTFNNTSNTTALDGRSMACGAHMEFNKSAKGPCGFSRHMNMVSIRVRGHEG